MYRYLNITIVAITISFFIPFSNLLGQQTYFKVPIKPNYKVSKVTPYKITLKTDLTVSLIGAALLTSSAIISNNTNPLTIEEVNQLDKNSIWKVDRFATNINNERAANASDVIFFSSIALPSLLLFDKAIRRDFISGVIYAETMLLAGGITSFTSSAINRKRPLAYNESIPDDIKTSKSSKRSFFSGHTSFTAAACFFMATIYSEHHPYSPVKPLVWTLAASMPFTVGALRVAAGRHYLTDVLVGYAVGASFGYLVPYLHKIYRRRSKGNQEVRKL